MGSGIEKQTRKIKLGHLDPLAKTKEKLEKAGRQAIEKPFRTGGSAQKRQAEALLKKQMQTEDVRRAEADDEIARRAATGRGGRKSLIKSSPTGLATNLGGT